MIQLWDINKCKSISIVQYLKYSINSIGSFMNFKDVNLYYANYGNKKILNGQPNNKLIFCDIRTNKPIKIVNEFYGEVDCHVTKKGMLVGINRESVDVIDLQAGYKNIRSEAVKMDPNKLKKVSATKNLNKQNHCKIQYSTNFQPLKKYSYNNSLLSSPYYNKSLLTKLNNDKSLGYLNIYQ